MNVDPLVTIITPAYNVEKYIGDFIDSIINQKYKHWELIIVDDGSTDKTLFIIEQYGVNDSRIHLVKRNRNPKGSLTCRNIGILQAKGDYIIHFDSDDLVSSCCLKQRVSFMETHLNCDYAIFKGGTIYCQKDGILKKTNKIWGEDPKKDVLNCFLKTEYPFSVWNNIYRASIFKNELWDEKIKIYTDFSFIVPCLIKGLSYEFANNNELDYYYRIGQEENMTANFIGEDKYQSTKYLFTKTLKNLEKLNKSKIYKKSFYKFFLLQLERVLVHGNNEQIEDYFIFIRKNYPQPSNIRIFIVQKIYRKYLINKNSIEKQRKVRMILYVYFKPFNYFKWLISKHEEKNYSKQVVKDKK